MLDIRENKIYKTRGGTTVRVYATDGAGDFSVHGAYNDGGGWEADCWTSDGKFFPRAGENGLDIEREAEIAEG